MEGVCELAEFIFNVPVHIGLPPVIGGLESEYRNPAFATAVGLVMLAADEMTAGASSRGKSFKPGARTRGALKQTSADKSGAGKIWNWLKDKFI